MAQLGVVVNIPNRTKAGLPNFIDIGEEAARLVRKDSGDNQASLVSVAITDQTMVAHAVDPTTVTVPVPSDKTSTRTITPKNATIAGGAAGNLTVSGIKTTNMLQAVIAVDDATHAGVDLTSQFTITASNTINNTGGSSTASKHVVVVWA